jgi:hypothetical protein
MAGGDAAKATRRTIDEARVWRPARGLARAGSDDIVVHADPAGVANLMRELIALRAFDVALEEHDGHWQVAVRGGPHPEEVLARIVDLAASCVEHGLMANATLCVGKRSYTIEPAPETGLPACAA